MTLEQDDISDADKPKDGLGEQLRDPRIDEYGGVDAHGNEIPIDLTRVPKDIVERVWFEKVYHGDIPQLTLRAVVMGSCIGGFMALSNLYVGLKTGWGLGVAITACIVAFAISKLFYGLGLFSSEMTILENNCMQSTASSAGYSTGGTMVSGISAYLLITGNHIPWHILVLWTIFLALLGVFMAIPMKRQMINLEQLRFPSGIAAAETLRGLHGKGEEAVKKAKALAAGGFFGGALTWVRDAMGKIPSSIPVPGSINGQALSSWTISFDMSAVLVAAGAIIGFRMGWSLLLGGLITYVWLAPKMVAMGAIPLEGLGYRTIVAWSTWTGASIMVTSGLFAFFTQWRTVIKAFSGIAELFTGKKSNADDPLKAIEVPDSWFLWGVIFSGFGCAMLLHFAFGTTFWMGLVAVAATFLLSVVACRATGESDITPIGAMGKITQLIFGFLAPSNQVTNLMTAGVTAGAAGSSADLLTDLKSGYLLGANPRQQFIAQFMGVFAGTIVVVPAFYALVPDAKVLGSDLWPAPSAQVWAAVARLLANGLDSLHPTARWGLLIGGLVGIALPLIEKTLPERFTKFVPSAMGIGLAMVIPFSNSFSMFLGASIVAVMEKVKPFFTKEYTIPIASGIIAGESLIGVLVALLSSFKII